ncbi:DUF6461 domain-containing protein [Actinacidiphila guanduensis]|uniref:Uncharacterized protein n=1 Tax=Actinacidiphila guanduensis TaxID=310781 RepID=A0A1H0R614_9ACTN|nr:DUF6461 domain-containing protein [Actinacidiphila guanduensis]SDO87574.1 hypothetical protein SAMN05216259_113225 [Actinacidiphila guanduensis]SDP24855.1 hypothetical protein SAMN05216259_1211 [Actinacidiphila guanduensis]
MESGLGWLAHASWYFSVTFVQGIGVHELASRLAADPTERPVLAGGRDVEALLGDPEVGVARLGDAGGWAFAAEYGEARGARRAFLAELSRSTGAAAVNLDPQAGHPPPMFSYAVGGELACSFGLAEEGRRWGSTPDLLNPDLRGAGVLLPDGSVMEVGAGRYAQRLAMSLGVIERHFGLSLPRDLVEDSELPTVAVSGRPDLGRL